MKIAFATCVQLGRSCIEEIIHLGGPLDLLITLKDDIARAKSGRIYLDDISEKSNIPLIKVHNINDAEVLNYLDIFKIDWLFIIGWSQIAYKKLIDTPRYGCIGMHPTLLPQGRGRASIPWAILYGLDFTGVTMFKIDEGIDTGDIIAQEKIPLNDSTTATELYQKVNNMHIQLIRNNWYKIISNTIRLKKQDETKASQWLMRRPNDGEITHAMTMQEASCLVRAVTHPYPGAFYIKAGKKVIVWSAKIDCNDGILRLKDGYLTPIEYEEYDAD